jgi:four helix bundle protein
MRNFRDLKVWEKAHRLNLEIYRVTKTFPRDEQYGLTSQLRRAAASVPANIAEGCGRDGLTELARFCRIAMGSASELEYHLLLAHDLGYLKDADHTELDRRVAEVKRMLTAFTQKLTADS